MTDIVERLSRLANWGGNATHLDYEGAILDAKAEIERLRADNARLRAALRVLADADTYMLHLAEWHDTGHMAAGVRSIASAALEGKE